MRDTSKSCILYDFLYCMGGAEKTTLKLKDAFPESRLCVDFINRKNFPTDQIPSSATELGKPSTCQPLNAIRGIHHFSNKTTFLHNYSRVIYSGSYAPCAVHNQKHGKRILYCHTPPRYAYDLYDYYHENVSPLLRPLFRELVRYTKRHYENAFQKMDVVIANSQNVRNRINKHLDAEAVIIHPPIDTQSFKWLEQGNFYLSTARLEKYKRVDLIIEAFKKMPDKKLVVTSGGSESEHLKLLAGKSPNIIFTGWLTHDELTTLMGKTIATIYMAMDEDFGMSPVESMAAGKPVIGIMEGGVMETVIHGETGMLIHLESEEIINAVTALHPRKAYEMKESCENRAHHFSTENFISKIRSLCA